ncbi:CynX/NimT family MFS transporter [Campylobacter hepaticus]|uniref:MFS transporter n=1 Tax=Campylobacter hepaticus TaxID=1813019 RepID=A0A424Z238_9BACT|nr:CynX/NimT family MFS transporter [Campylobacter hepaticus]AXP08464.1 MFS transporter [Campylobacter hepaticus]MCZ0772299.1 CynX/NimT family MFS transporter [Campylobacter hepaticus]MCZ0773767.1 CynX/NimT family MFS transporter [Campylobacter hepaticus]MCZ0775018.1 CynX/NimT family MFS transporter [Campylobacter hepaticus]MDX2322887.1 CynX/NimT family MFS transporter [Campylobacter hepaticus]
MGVIYKKIFWLNFFIVIIIAFNLRAPITTIGPIIDSIKDAYGLNSTLAGILTSLPLIAFGSISFVVGYFSPIRAIIVGIFLIFIGELLRSYTGVYGLFIGMLGIGCGIAIANVLLPSFIKEKFPKKMATMMGVYSLVLSISSIAGIALIIPLLSVFNLAGAMAFWAVFSFIALVVYYPQAKNGRFFRTKKKQFKEVNLFTHPTTWKITFFMGFQSFLAYSLFFWYVQMIVEKGFDREFATDIVLFAQLIAAPISLFGPLLLGKLKQNLHTIYIGSLCSMYVLAFIILFIFDGKIFIIISAFIMGFPWGGVFGIALLFIALKSSNTQIAAKLSALAQGFGYLIAAQGQWLIGLMHDKFENFTSSILMLIFIGILINIFGYLSYKSRIIK